MHRLVLAVRHNLMEFHIKLGGRPLPAVHVRRDNRFLRAYLQLLLDVGAEHQVLVSHQPTCTLGLTHP